MSKYINPECESTLSRTAYALVLPLAVLANKHNEIDKADFIKHVSWISDYRTWNKYWTELEKHNVLVRLDKKTWMISPHQCYTDGMSHTTLINKWNEVKNALKQST